jgi:hypothetical protein
LICGKRSLRLGNRRYIANGASGLLGIWLFEVWVVEKAEKAGMAGETGGFLFLYFLRPWGTLSGVEVGDPCLTATTYA